MPYQLTRETAGRFAEIALGHVTKEYPHKLDHVMDGPEDVCGPRALHPIFFGSFDWHSCVHSYWLLLRTRRLFPGLPAAARVEALLGDMLTPEKVAGELDYLDRAYTGGFERPYGWAWLLALHREAQLHEEDWAQALEPLARAFAERFEVYLPKLTYPIRTGTHGGDRDYHGWEPGGDDFLSGGLAEAMLMRLVLPDAGFREWLGAFLPKLASGEPRSLLTPATVSDRSDGKIAHLDGLNLSRAWCWRGIAGALEPALAALAGKTADAHLAASLPHVAGDYMGEHWLATFALLALER